MSEFEHVFKGGRFDHTWYFEGLTLLDRGTDSAPPYDKFVSIQETTSASDLKLPDFS